MKLPKQSKNQISENSTFFNDDLFVIQKGGPKVWEKNESKKPNWELNQPELSYYLGKKIKKKLKIDSEWCIKVIISEGFITDGGSFNNLLVPVIDATPTGRFFRAFLLHDALARTDFFTFGETNKILDEALELLGMNWISRQAIYTALSLFGSPTKKKNLLANAKKFVKVKKYKLIS
jgi:hypothetical protein